MKRYLAFLLAACTAAAAFAQTTVPNPLAPDKPVPTIKPAPAPAPKERASGGGADKIWANSASKVYHCAGSKYYGKTKKGEYMTEADARAKGYHGVGGKSCT